MMLPVYCIVKFSIIQEFITNKHVKFRNNFGKIQQVHVAEDVFLCCLYTQKDMEDS